MLQSIDEGSYRYVFQHSIQHYIINNMYVRYLYRNGFTGEKNAWKVLETENLVITTNTIEKKL